MTKRLAFMTLLFLPACGKSDVVPARPVTRVAPEIAVTTAAPGVQDAATSIMNHRQVLFRVQFRRVGRPKVTQKQIDDCLGPGYSLVIDRIARRNGQETDIHILYLKIPKTVAVADIATKLESLTEAEQVRFR